MDPEPETIKAFRAGAKSIFTSWSLIDLALEGGFGGPFTQNICQDIFYDLLALFDKEGSSIDQDLVAEFLYQCLDTDLHIDIEENDDSVEKIATVFVKLYTECMKGDYELLNTLLTKNARFRPTDKLFEGKKITQWPPPVEPEPVLVAPPDENPVEEQPASQVDPDGWVTVTKKKGRGGKR